VWVPQRMHLRIGIVVTVCIHHGHAAVGIAPASSAGGLSRSMCSCSNSCRIRDGCLFPAGLLVFLRARRSLLGESPFAGTYSTCATEWPRKVKPHKLE
jgi:hypothetical protein